MFQVQRLLSMLFASKRQGGLDILSYDSEKTVIVNGMFQPPCQLVWQELKVGS